MVRQWPSSNTLCDLQGGVLAKTCENLRFRDSRLLTDTVTHVTGDATVAVGTLVTKNEPNAGAGSIPPELPRRTAADLVATPPNELI